MVVAKAEVFTDAGRSSKRKTSKNRPRSASPWM
jgi:hypothetical protein